MPVDLPATGPLTGPHITAVAAAIADDLRIRGLGTRAPADRMARALQATRFASQPGMANRLLDAVGTDEEAKAIERLGEQGYILGGDIVHRGDLACLAAIEVLRERVRRALKTNDASAEQEPAA